MIDLYYWTTPNGHKITLFLEESGLPYRITPVNIGAGEQFAPDFLAIAPNNGTFASWVRGRRSLGRPSRVRLSYRDRGDALPC